MDSMPDELVHEALKNLRAQQIIRWALVVTLAVSFVVSVVALSLSLVSFHKEAQAAKAQVKYEVSEQCALYAAVGELQPSLNPPTSKFAMGLVTDLRNKFTSLGCPGTLPVSKALIELDERYHLKLDR
jgi:hypothetical protein